MKFNSIQSKDKLSSKTWTNLGINSRSQPKSLQFHINKSTSTVCTNLYVSGLIKVIIRSPTSAYPLHFQTQTEYSTLGTPESYFTQTTSTFRYMNSEGPIVPDKLPLGQKALHSFTESRKKTKCWLDGRKQTEGCDGKHQTRSRQRGRSKGLNQKKDSAGCWVFRLSVSSLLKRGSPPPLPADECLFSLSKWPSAQSSTSKSLRAAHLTANTLIIWSWRLTVERSRTGC